MSLFQKSVVNKYLNNLDRQVLLDKWNAYKNHFLNPSVQVDIRNLKEEQYQGEFLEDLFVKILGYTKPASSSETKFNLTTEYKNVKDSKKADGAIIFDDKVKAVIELKGTNTTDLGKIEAQAFGYKNNQPDCVYVITSNFEKLRFYIENAIEHIEFNLFTLTEEEFQLLYLCLGFDNLSQNIAKKIKEESLSEEDVITKKLYNDYSLFKRELHQSLVLLNPQFDALTLFQKSQKLLDRFLFLFFAEDRQLLPPNSVRLILEQWVKLNDLDAYTPLFDRFKKYFGYLNTGFKGKQYDVYAYNGGLFKEDDVLDAILIDDDLLYKHTLTLSDYDFASEVDVNILGHIFENSLNELDEIKAQLEGQEIDKSKTKRKKDGVFYTPKYITKYIVENTVGKLCKEKKEELEIIEDDYFIDKKRQKKTIKGLIDKLTEYRKWLLHLTICDPACGSGAFLNQALDFLILEHRYVDELQAKLFGDALVLSDVEKSILENNLFGVDLNEESVEIAKLSLWLRTAQPNRKLNDLSGNIKCGNSLIDDVKVAGDKAFNWQQAFPKVFEKGGFDVIIGNPPYVRVQSLKEHYFEQSIYLEKKYKSATGKYDLYALFLEKSNELINIKGIVSYILPHKFLVADFGVGIRQYLAENKLVDSILHFGSHIIFQQAATYTCIINLKRNCDVLNYLQISPIDILGQLQFNTIFWDKLSSSPWNLQSDKSTNILEKIIKHKALKDICEGIYQGLITIGDDIFMLEGTINGEVFNGYSNELGEMVDLESNILLKVLKGQDIKRNLPLESNRYVIYPHIKNQKGKTIPLEPNEFELKYPLTFNYLSKFKNKLIDKKIRYKTNPKYWYSLHRSRELSIFEKEYIITPQLQNIPSFTVKENTVVPDAGGYILVPKKEYNYLDLLSVLNSKLMWFFIKNTSSEYGGGYFYFKTKYLEPFSIPDSITQNHEFRNIQVIQLNNTKVLYSQIGSFQRTIQRKFELEALPKKLQDWYKLSFAEFIKELAKKKVKLSLSQEADWEDHFLAESKKALDLKATIDATDKEIDAMVYELYGLSEDEIALVEKG